MVMSGTLERHPGVNVLLAHGGGAIVALRGRLRRGQAVIGGRRGPGRRRFDPAVPVRHGTPRPGAVRVLVEAVGADRVLLGSDYPFDMGDPQPVQTVRSAGLSADEERAVLCGNAERSVGLVSPVDRHPRPGGDRPLGPAADRERRRLQRLRADDGVDLALGSSGSRRGARRRTDTWSSRGGRGGRASAERRARRSFARRCASTSPSSCGCSTSSATGSPPRRPCEPCTKPTRCSTRPPQRVAGGAGGGFVYANLRRPAGGRSRRRRWRS